MTVGLGPSAVLEQAAAILDRAAGMACPPSREPDLARALRECCRRNGIADLRSYLVHLDHHPSLLDDLVGALAVGETYFFRDAGQFDLLRTTVLPAVIRDSAAAPRIWSAGCASGEEAYSLAILLAEAGADLAPPVVGTDISHDALDRAAKGIYGEWSFRGVPEGTRRRYFEPSCGRWRVRDDIRARVRFERLNLVAKQDPSVLPGIGGMHLILCRNVLIYLTADAIASVARRLHDSLAPGGWLLTGASDPPLADLAPFETVVTRAGVVYRRTVAFARIVVPVTGPAVVGPPADPAPEPTRAAPPGPERTAGTRPRGTSLEDLRSRLHALADRGEHDRLERLLAHALRTHPFEPEFHYLSALVCLEHGRDAAAADAARRALYLEPGLAVAAVALGSALRRLGDLPGARRAYRSAAASLRRDPPDAAVSLAGGEAAGGLLRSIDSLVAGLAAST